MDEKESFCHTPKCKEDLIDRIAKVNTKLNTVCKTRISKTATYTVATIAVAILLGASTLMYTSYAAARDKRTDLIEKNTEVINNVRIQQVEIKTKLNLELQYIKEGIKKNRELSRQVLEELKKQNGTTK